MALYNINIHFNKHRARESSRVTRLHAKLVLFPRFCTNLRFAISAVSPFPEFCTHTYRLA